MKKLFLLKILFILSGGIGTSQITLTGKITDKKTGEPLIGAAVYMPDLKTGEYADDKGFYKISNLPASKVLVQVSNIGYKTVVTTIDLKTTSSLNFEMEEDVMEVGGVVITAPSKTTEIKKRQEGQQWGDEHGVEIDEYSVSRIEVIKGPSSLTYGSDALAGVVNLIPAPPVPDNDIRGSLLSEYQTNNGLIGNSLALNNTRLTGPEEQVSLIWEGISDSG